MPLTTLYLDGLLGPAKPTGRVFRFHQGGHRNFLFLNAKVTACGLPAVKRPKPGQRMVIPALSAFMGNLSHLLPCLGNLDATIRRRRLARAGGDRTMARPEICGAIRSCRGA